MPSRPGKVSQRESMAEYQFYLSRSRPMPISCLRYFPFDIIRFDLGTTHCDIRTCTELFAPFFRTPPLIRIPESSYCQLYQLITHSINSALSGHAPRLNQAFPTAPYWPKVPPTLAILWIPRPLRGDVATAYRFSPSKAERVSAYLSLFYPSQSLYRTRKAGRKINRLIVYPGEVFRIPEISSGAVDLISA